MSIRLSNPISTEGSPSHGCIPLLKGIILILSLGLASCSSTVKVKTQTGALTRASLQTANLLRNTEGPGSSVTSFGTAGEDLLKNARSLETRGKKADAAGHYLKVAADARDLLDSGTEKPDSATGADLLEIHKAALARFAELWSLDPRRHEPGRFRIPGGTESFEVVFSGTSAYREDFFDRLVASESIKVEGMPRNLRQGWGAPLVGIRDQLPDRAEEMKFFPKRGLHTSVTMTMDAVARPSGGGGVTRVTLSLRNPMLEDTAKLGARQVPLAADFTAPIAVVMKGRNQSAFGLQGFFEAEERLDLSGIYLMEPYDPGRIPVLFIHGLVSSPYIWREILSGMMADPDLSKRYQFMVFGYPSSLPLLESSALLRENLAALRAKYDPDGTDPLSRNMIVAGHSMGGMMTHTLVAEIGNNLWKQFSDTPLDELPFEEKERENLRKLVHFKPDPAVRRVVYFSAPHRGAKMAEKDIAGMLSKMAKLPSSVVQDTRELTDSGINAHLKIPIQKKYTSRESLEPGAPMVVAMDVSPYKPGVIYHSVIGDQGKGDTPNSSDGVVEYWSSHQPGAASELIVPSGHSSYEHPLAVAELRRILRLHVGL